MMQTFDIDAIVYKMLNVPAITDVISGGVYVGEDDRPDDSAKEDIVINSITLTQDYLPQLGTSNVNIFVPDKARKINGKQQYKERRQRLKLITKKVTEIIRSTIVTGLKISLGPQTVIAKADIKQHYVNIRLSWNIQTE
jgi:hypothetical protein